MNRLFGTSRAKGPAPNLTDSIANIDARGDSVEKKIQKLDVSFRHNIDIIINHNDHQAIFSWLNIFWCV